MRPVCRTYSLGRVQGRPRGHGARYGFRILIEVPAMRREGGDRICAATMPIRSRGSMQECTLLRNQTTANQSIIGNITDWRLVVDTRRGVCSVTANYSG